MIFDILISSEIQQTNSDTDVISRLFYHIHQIVLAKYDENVPF